MCKLAVHRPITEFYTGDSAAIHDSVLDLHRRAAVASHQNLDASSQVATTVLDRNISSHML